MYFSNSSLDRLSISSLNSLSNIQRSFGALIYGNGIKTDKNYFVRPYAKYKKNNSVTVIYGETVKHKATTVNPIP